MRYRRDKYSLSCAQLDAYTVTALCRVPLMVVASLALSSTCGHDSAIEPPLTPAHIRYSKQQLCTEFDRFGCQQHGSMHIALRMILMKTLFSKVIEFP